MNLSVNPKQLYEMARSSTAEGRAFSFIAKGDSMRPFIKNGQQVTIIAKDRYAPGDIVLAHTSDPDGIFLHYLTGETINNDPSDYLLMGSANLRQREKAYLCDIAGAVINPTCNRHLLMLWHRLLPLRPLLIRLINIVSRARHKSR
ncbi:S24/S26 family peptidase [uncultured Duncaniella sp.]|uniref:S24/S26 family peptidase n=2 Tax=uncultured Duncaniella sp. TaxID=2768039 RepID=UPI00261D49EE|nr:S24/S26 family peptidase [uncultured Duncaniella sp.]